MSDPIEQIVSVVGRKDIQTSPLRGGCVGRVLLVEWGGKPRLVAKVDQSQKPRLDVEAFMLRYLAENTDLPVPAVVFAEPNLLLLEFLPGRNHFSAGAERHAAELMADLHSITVDGYGFERDTLIGGLGQPNEWSDSWLSFFRERRLVYMAQVANQAGRLPDSLLMRVAVLADDLGRWLSEPPQAALIHGDAWAGNVLAVDDRIAGFVDPAIYYADPEIELAFISLFDSFSEPFFRRYNQLRPIADGFGSERRHLYNLYPLLVHVRLFGGSYVGAVERTLNRFGY